MVSALGGRPLLVPTVGITTLEGAGDGRRKEVESFVRAISEGGIDYVVFMTGPGTQTLLREAESLGLLERFLRALTSGEGPTVIARSSKPKHVLEVAGVGVDLMPPRRQATEGGIISLLKRRDLRGKTIAIVWHGSYSSRMREELLLIGAGDVIECSPYSYSRELTDNGAKVLRSMGYSGVVPPADDAVTAFVGGVTSRRLHVDALTFTSPPAASNLFETARGRGMGEGFVQAIREEGVIVAAVGPSTRMAVERFGVRVDVVPEVPAMGAMVTALAEFASRAVRSEG